ncbi:glycosyltransferase family 2 protein [Thalassolituus sp. C2-1]|uniref:glycosyltransferase family 2 protein n=1 Tax=Venatorbacter sp. C2-1 TaxID=2597518 RepID=UPI001190EFFE|nr:glycosyltransferase family 2 protein [Thalassolituus sp. C2-1]TVV42216.1 glycosyltransferase family 2 protein [Thalassolituus sp. C2-1]
MSSDVKVSVCINAFNHQNTIGKTIESIVGQKTDFSFEVVIFDDFSTDGTRSIIQRYSFEYPGLIRYIFKECNLFSINGHLPFIECWSAAKGQYIALCEGDDYWIDPLKLQKQYDAIRENDVDICFTNAYMEYSGGRRKEYFTRRESSKHMSLREVIKSGGGGMPTASIIMKAELLRNLPDWFVRAPVGDYFIQIIGARRSGAFYLNEVTCVYTVCSANSWTMRRKSILSDQIKKEICDYEYVFDSLKNEVGNHHSLDLAFSGVLAGSATLSCKSGDWSLAKMLLKKSIAMNNAISLKYRLLYLLTMLMKIIK